MYVVGGFDGSRLNDLYLVALPSTYEDTDEAAQSVHRFRPQSGTESASQILPSDASVVSHTDLM